MDISGLLQRFWGHSDKHSPPAVGRTPPWSELAATDEIGAAVQSNQ
jgi:hypothetical protein